jgi:hypothetical protein
VVAVCDPRPERQAAAREQQADALTVYGKVSACAETADYLPPEGWSHLDTWLPLAQTGLNPVVDVEDLSMVTMALDNGVFATYQQCHYTPDYWRNYTVIGTEGRLENFGDETEGGHGSADPRIVAEFLQYVRTGGATLTGPLAAREAVAVGCAATQSLRAGDGAIDVPPSAGTQP